jgi:hypothetical protein
MGTELPGPKGLARLALRLVLLGPASAQAPPPPAALPADFGKLLGGTGLSQYCPSG